MRRECSDPLKQFTVYGSGKIDLLYFVPMTKKLGVCDCQKILVPTRVAGDDCNRIRVWLEAKHEIDRFPKTPRACDAGHPWPHLLLFEIPRADSCKDNRNTGKYFVAVFHREVKCRGVTHDHDIQLDLCIPAAESLGHALPIRFHFHLRVFQVCAIERDWPPNTSPHRGFNQFQKRLAILNGAKSCLHYRRCGVLELDLSGFPTTHPSGTQAEQFAAGKSQSLLQIRRDYINVFPVGNPQSLLSWRSRISFCRDIEPSLARPANVDCGLVFCNENPCVFVFTVKATLPTMNTHDSSERGHRSAIPFEYRGSISPIRGNGFRKNAVTAFKRESSQETSIADNGR